MRPVLLEFMFDPIDLRTKRQDALANTMNTPLFKERQEVKEFTVARILCGRGDSGHSADIRVGRAASV